MKFTTLIAITCFLLFTASGNSQQSSPLDTDTRPITSCENLTSDASILYYTPAKTADLCRQMLGVLKGVRLMDIRRFAYRSAMMSISEYKTNAHAQISSELIEIVRLRGLQSQPDRWKPTSDVVFKSWIGLNRTIGPDAVVAFLRSSGPKAAKDLSDDGLLNMIAFIKVKADQSGR